MRVVRNLGLIISLAALAGCGGVGGGGGASLPGGGSISTPTPTPIPTPVSTPTPIPTPVSTPTPTPAPTLQPQSIQGKIVDYNSGSGISGATITVGALPNTNNCALSQTATVMPCAIPASPLPTVTTAADGSFTVNNVQTILTGGKGMLTASNGSTYATLHISFTASGSSTNIGTYKLTSLSTDEQNWLVDVNNQRATVSYPQSFGNLVIDEYAEEQARQWAADCAAGKLGTCGDSSYSAYGTAYSASAGAIYQVAGVLCQDTGPGNWSGCDNAWMGEKSNCPGGNWQTCTFAGNTGHYINLSNTVDSWVGLGESSTVDNWFAGEYSYNVMIIQNPGPGPASRLRQVL